MARQLQKERRYRVKRMAQKQGGETMIKSDSELREQLQEKKSFKQYISDKIQNKKCIKIARRLVKIVFITGLFMIVIFPFITCIKEEYVQPSCQTFRDYIHPCIKGNVNFCCISNLCDQKCIENVARLEKREEHCMQLFYAGVWLLALSLLVNLCVRAPRPQEKKDNETEMKTFQPGTATYVPPTIICNDEIQRTFTANRPK